MQYVSSLGELLILAYQDCLYISISLVFIVSPFLKKNRHIGVTLVGGVGVRVGVRVGVCVPNSCPEYISFLISLINLKLHR